MKKFLKQNLWIAGVITGAIAGYFYWKNIGCVNGTCLITSKPVNSILYFGLMGGLFFSIFQPKKKLPPENIDTKNDNPDQ